MQNLPYHGVKISLKQSQGVSVMAKPTANGNKSRASGGLKRGVLSRVVLIAIDLASKQRKRGD